MSEPLDYRSPRTPDARPGRSLSTWLLLLVVWLVGIVIWGIYIALGIIIFFKIF